MTTTRFSRNETKLYVDFKNRTALIFPGIRLKKIPYKLETFSKASEKFLKNLSNHF